MKKGIFMRFIVLTLVAFMDVRIANAAEIIIFDVRKAIALSEKEKVERDFYINAGAEAGLQAGTTITVYRKIPLYDTFQSRAAGDLKVPVAKVKIISVQQNLSVARSAGEFSRSEIPILEDNFVMKGDYLDLATATVDKKSASIDEEPQAPAPAKPETPATPPAAAAPAPTPPPSAAAPTPIEGQT